MQTNKSFVKFLSVMTFLLTSVIEKGFNYFAHNYENYLEKFFEFLSLEMR